MTLATKTKTVLEARGLRKSFGHIEAVTDASLELHAGEIVALVGDNGAGKSTFTKMISGMVVADGGELLFDGKPTTIGSVGDAQALGIQTVYQDLAQAPDLSPQANVFLGREIFAPGIRGRLGVLDRDRMRRETEEALDRLGIKLPSVSAPVRELSGGQRQAVAVARAVMWATTAVLMDEPTAALGARQTAIVYETIRKAAERGLAVLVVSHDIPSILKVADRVAVMRHGRVIETHDTSEVSVNDVLQMMLGGLPLVNGGQA
jgi:simple sugar transport system ATP-binding protein